MHNPIFIVIDSLNRRIIAEGGLGQGAWRKEWFAPARMPLLVLVDQMMREISQPKVSGWEIGIYAGPGPFSQLRKGVILGHWLARTMGGKVRSVPLSAINGAKRLSVHWRRFPVQVLPKIRYGKKPSITRKPKK